MPAIFSNSSPLPMYAIKSASMWCQRHEISSKSCIPVLSLCAAFWQGLKLIIFLRAYNNVQSVCKWWASVFFIVPVCYEPTFLEIQLFVFIMNPPTFCLVDASRGAFLAWSFQARWAHRCTFSAVTVWGQFSGRRGMEHGWGFHIRVQLVTEHGF